MYRLIAYALTAVLGFSLLAMLATGMGPQPAPPKDTVLMVASTKPKSDEVTGGAVSLARDQTGQFRIDGAVNGEDVRFLVDTGADVVAFGPDEAERLGVSFDPATFTEIMHTASGTARGTLTTIDRLEVAGRELRDVPVAVVEGLQINLLGQSALRRLGNVAMQGDRMVIGG